MSSRAVFRGRLVGLRVDEVRVLPEGRAASREIVEHPGAVAVVPVTTEGEVVLVRQYRYAAGEELLEIPAGTLEPGEEPAACAVRELREETGRSAAALEPLGSLFSSPGFCDEVIHLFLARLEDPGDEASANGERGAYNYATDEDERLEVVVLSLERAVGLARDGRLRDAKTVAGLCLAALRLDDGCGRRR
ncbi:MAG: NUDIX hydrolase [Bacillota bacterium]